MGSYKCLEIQKRSDFAATLASGGAQGLAKRINALADQMLS